MRMAVALVFGRDLFMIGNGQFVLAADDFRKGYLSQTNTFGSFINPKAWTKGYSVSANVEWDVNENLTDRWINGWLCHETGNRGFDVDGTIFDALAGNTFQDFRQALSEPQVNNS